MKHVLIKRFDSLFSLTTDLAHIIEEPEYQSKLSTVRSNSFGEQLLCIVGARESYLQQIKSAGEFTFSCSVSDSSNKFKIMQALHMSAQQVIQYAKENPTDEQVAEILFKILEHEAQHHGQLIRYVYGNDWQFPESWKSHYTV